MIVYSSNKSNFIRDVNDFSIEKIVLGKFRENLHRTTGQSEIDSWRDSLPYMSQVLSDPSIPDDAGVLIEYMIPQSSFRIDFIITGLGDDERENVIIVELKRWSEVEMTDKTDIVRTRFQGRMQETSHPSYQAWSYAAFLESFNETIYTDQISLNPCAYLHNYEPDGLISDARYQYFIDKAPLFLKSDKQKLREFIKRYIRKGDSRDIMYRIENGKIRPSKALADSLASMLKGNREFIMVDDQKLVYETAVSTARMADEDHKHVLLVQGGPGTGKSVVAVNLLVGLTNLGLVAKYVTKNSAPREVYKVKLSGHFRGSVIDSLFTGSGAFFDATDNVFDALIVDEAHRLNEKSGMFMNLGENQVQEIINASRFSVFFLDEDQKVTTRDIGSRDEILKWAAHYRCRVQELELRSQFRCNGSNGYLAWLDNTLQIRETANIFLEKGEYDFTIVDSPAEMRDIIYELNKKDNKARMVAGYCWNWASKNDKTRYDIEFPEYGFRHQWNLSDDGMRWIIDDDSVTEIGCIHTSQGLELDHIGVIVGKDLVVRNGQVITNFRERSVNDSSMKGLKSLARTDPERAAKEAGHLIKNTYRTLMTRGMRSCHVYFVDDETREYFKERVR